MSNEANGSVSDSLAELRATVGAFPGQRFAVVDGGHFEDLPARLRRERLFARSLFLDQADIEVQKAGPWLIPLDQAPEATGGVFAIVGDKPAAVFWCCDAGEAILYRHLRTLNMARIPVWAADGKEAPGPSDELDAYRPVFFRHFDPRVLGALMPCLDAAQFARMLGRAEEIAFDCPDHGGLKRVVNDFGSPRTSAALLTVRSDQIEDLNSRRMTASRRRIAAYLREHAPQMTEHATDRQLLDFVAESEGHGRPLGIESEAAHGRWAYLMLRSEKRILASPVALDFIRSGDKAPDRQVEILLRETAVAMRDAELRSGWRRGG